MIKLFKSGYVSRILFLPVFFFVFLQANAQKIRIACVGNSITYGYGVVNRQQNSYPAQLQHLLGNDYEVGNFGVSGTTLLKKGNLPYWNTKAYSDALAFQPNIVFIMLGTNDSKAVNRPYLSEFESDYVQFIHQFSELPSHPRIVLLLPIPSFLTDSNSIYDPVITKQIIPAIQSVAYKTNRELVGLYNLFVDKSNLLPDKIHPSSIGAGIIARRLYETVKLYEKNDFDIFSKMKMPVTHSSFYGFNCADFIFKGRHCKIVQPRKAADGLPWIWRARFWGHEPQTDLALLERGFHLVYCDVSEWYGNKEAVNSWNSFYTLLRQAGLARKVVLEGMSRGGVYIYNWALANPRKVACIYADAPVLDLKSWPGGKGKSKGSTADWKIFKKDYSLTEEQALHFSHSPLDNAAKIAKLHFPMLHVVGDADEVVPVEENTAPFEKIILSNGGNIKVIHKPGVNHHPHSLKDPTPIVDFILLSTGYKTNFAALAAPGNEYRSAAGWTAGADWWQQNADIDSLLLAEKNLDILFIGNSITQGMAGNRPRVTYQPGKEAVNRNFGQYRWECAGISGDRTQNVLWRLKNGNYAVNHPKVAVLTIGVNNFPDDEPEEIATGIDSILHWMSRNMSGTKIVLVGPLPAGLQKDDPKRVKYEKVQGIISKFKQQNMVYFPSSQLFIQPDGALDPAYNAGDGIHLKPAGYERWANGMKELLVHLLQ